MHGFLSKLSSLVIIRDWVTTIQFFIDYCLNSKEGCNFSDILINGRFNQVRTGVTGKSISKDEDKIMLFMQHLGHLS